MKEAIILAGGFGTRLQSVVKDIPKPMAPINGKPFLTFLFAYLQKFGYERVVLSTGYLHDTIEDYFGEKYQDIFISYAHEDQPLGTGGAIQYALGKCQSQQVLVLNGDTLFKVDLNAFLTSHQQHNGLLSMVLRNVEDVSRYGSVVVDKNHRVANFVEKASAQGAGLINGGIYLLDRKLFEMYPHTGKFSFEKEIMQSHYEEENFYGFPSDAYFIDIGIPEDYNRAQKELK